MSFLELVHRLPPAQTAVYGWDTETFRFGPGLMAPPLVCLSYQKSWPPPPGATGFDTLLKTAEPVLLNDSDGVDWFWTQINDPRATLVAHNAAYDVLVLVHELVRRGRDFLEVLTKVMDAYEEGRIRCTHVRQKLLDISQGEHKFYRDRFGRMQKTTHDLAACVLRHLDHKLEKADTWRLRYGELFGMPVADYPEEARRYSLQDSTEVLELFWSQAKSIEDTLSPGFMPNEVEQTAVAFAFHMMSAYGFRADPVATAKLKAEYTEIRDVACAKLLTWGLVRPEGFRCVRCEQLLVYQGQGQFTHRPGKKCELADGTGLKLWLVVPEEEVTPGKYVKNMAAMREVVRELYDSVEEETPLTDGGAMSTDQETLSYFDQRTEDDKPVDGFWDERVEAWLEAQGNVLSTWVPALEEACKAPAHPRYNVLVESGRISCGKPNICNPPRKGGVRECFVPRPGFVYVGADYDTLELRTLAQTTLEMFGYSEMASALQRGEDLHASFAASRLGISYEDFMVRLKGGDVEAKEARQRAKAAMFGFPGGLGAKTYMSYAKAYGLNLTLAEAKEIKAAYLARWPEMVEYFRFIGDATEADVPLVHPRSNRVCGRVRYTKRANGYFQGRAADGSKEAVWALMRECYLGEDRIGDLNGARSPLFGSRPILHLYDENIMESPEQIAHECAVRLVQVMEAGMQIWIPDIPAKASPVVMRRWRKGAEGVKVNGRYVPGNPEARVGADGKKKVVWVHDQ